MSLAGLFSQRWPGVALFDLDGTLVDSAPDLAAAIDAMLEQLGRRKAGADNVRQWVGNGASVLVRQIRITSERQRSAAAMIPSRTSSNCGSFGNRYRVRQAG